MRKFNVLLLLLIAMSILVVFVQAEEEVEPVLIMEQVEPVTKMAEDVDCLKCHPEDPHIIHTGQPVQCVNCHGETLSIKIPQCLQCHNGPIHKVHGPKVATEECSYCHSGIETFHIELISNTLCSHCHRDLVDVHGGPDVSCAACHETAPNIVAPVKLEGTTVVCQNCHTATDVALIHGDAENRTACYNCHRPGAREVQAASEIPHFIHIPNVDCNSCHLSQETGKVYLPECAQCHKADEIHAYNKIALNTASTGLRCSVCHPMADEDETTTDATAASTKAPVSTVETEEPSTGIPGFGAVLAISSLALLYIARRYRK
ncbi:MAG TPA: cytochrome c3 family protein [archaeon]|nr:cytochrome c3 family protein [archaeon]